MNTEKIGAALCSLSPTRRAAIGDDGWFAVEDETGKDVETSLRTARPILARQLRAGEGR